MHKNKISVALCTYNGERYIREQLNSIINQTLPPYELIISDDHSTDATLSVITGVIAQVDFPVKVFIQNSNVGVNENFASAISMCTGEYIALADQDDVWHTEKLQRFSEEFSKFGESIPPLLYSDLKLIDGQGNTLRKRFSEAVRLDRAGGRLWLKLAFGNFIPGCSMVFDRRYVKDILPIPSEAILHDWWIALVISMTGGLHYIDSELMSYRIHRNNTQGMHSFKRTLKRISKFGIFTIASNNFLITLRQLQTASNRLQQHSIAGPAGLIDICKIRNRSRAVRPYVLFSLGIRRVSALLGSLLVRSGQFCDDSIGHQ